MSSHVKELRHCLRRLLMARGFSFTVIVMLGVGIGTTTMMFSLIEGILLKPLPFQDPARLVELGEHVSDGPGIGATARDIAVYSAQSSAFSATGGYENTSYELSGGAAPESVSGARVTAGVFRTLAVQPAQGRAFSADEEAARANLAVISDSLWLRRFHRDPHVLGQVVELDRKAYSIVGVMPRGFEFPVRAGRVNQAQVWVPMSLTPEELSDEAAGRWGFKIVARLKDGVTMEGAAQDAARVANEIMRNFPPTMGTIRIRGDVAPLSQVVTGQTRPLLRALFLAVCVVLLIACANVAILMLVRAVRRHREHAVRLALGAGSGAMLRGMLWEGLVLSTAGGLLGLGLSLLMLRSMINLLPDSMPRIDSVSVDGRVLLFALATSLFTGVICSVAPAFAAMRTNLLESLKESTRAGTGGASHSRIRGGLVTAEIAIALMLLTLTGALLRSYLKMLMVDPGFQPEHLVVAGYQLPLREYGTDEAVNRFDREVLDRLRNEPGVTAAGMGNTLPSSGDSGLAGYTLEGERTEGWKLKFAAFGEISGDYFNALGIPLLAGRAFDENDRGDRPPVVIVSKSMAEHSWPGQNPLGKRLHAGNPKRTNMSWATVVGVVGNTRIGPRDSEGNDQWYIPDAQPDTLFGKGSTERRALPEGGFIVMRSALAEPEMMSMVRAAVAKVDPQLALDPVESMSQVVAKTEGPRHFMTELIGAFALCALGLAITGIYAVMSFSVSVRTQEIAIRMALGAQRHEIAGLVVRGGIRLALVGCGLGVAGSIAASRLVRALLFGVSSTDPLVYVSSVVVMLSVTALAAALPAARAAREDPVRALRSV